MNDVIDEVASEFPDIERSSIEKICKTGMLGIKKIISNNEELIIKAGAKDEIKFFIPCSPEVQDVITKNNLRKRFYSNLKKTDGKESD